MTLPTEADIERHRIAEAERDIQRSENAWMGRRIEALEDALRPFAKAWEIAHKVAPKGTLGQIGHMCAYEVSGVHFQKALRVLEDETN